MPAAAIRDKIFPVVPYQILVVDDQHDARYVLRSGLETLGPGFQITDVPSGEEALLVASSQPVDLLVVDVRLAGISGLELIDKIRQRNPGLKYILFTGLTDPEVRRQVEAAGAEAVFYKPVDMDSFLVAVQLSLGLPQGPITPGLHIGQPIQPATPAPVEEHLASLRRELGAIAIVLLDERGQVVARQGELPEIVLDPGVMSALVQALEASGLLSRSLGRETPGELLYFSGQPFDLYAAHVSYSLAMLVVAQTTAGERERLDAMRMLRQGIAGMVDLLMGEGMIPQRDMQTSPPVEAGDHVPVSPEEASVLEAVFRKASLLAAQEVEDFWEQLADQCEINPEANGNTLSFDQARRLGLVSDDAGE